ncbi:uncharacterized protein LOC143443759 isoform X3 [Arvicanthis niloticus]|uniref:uncharacterized protein LOC143314033 isoform X3 n=1 Tax=Arvicanthis niloticus TaxID=61156 RepID=UPI00402B791D
MQRRKDGAPEQELPGTLHTSPAANANKSMNVFSSVALHSPRRQPGFLGSCSDFFRLVTVELLDSVPYPRMEHWWFITLRVWLLDYFPAWNVSLCSGPSPHEVPGDPFWPPWTPGLNCKSASRLSTQLTNFLMTGETSRETQYPSMKHMGDLLF